MNRQKITRLLAALLVAVLALSACSVPGSSGGEAVNVYPFEYLGMTEYWADSQESYGPVRTDDIQTIYVSETQTITQLLVAEGDTVAKGDLLMVFDTTLTNLSLERERLNVEKLKLQLQEARDYLKELRAMKPMEAPTAPPEIEETEPDPGVMLTEPWQISLLTEFDGSSPDTALICWIREDTEISDELLAAVHQAAVEYRAENLPEEPLPEETGTNEDTGDTADCLWPTWPGWPSCPTEPSEEATEPSGEATEPTPDSTEPSDEPTQPEEPTEPAPAEDAFYVVLKVTEGNRSLAAATVWQGLHVTFRNGSYRFTLYNAMGFADHTVIPEDEPAEPLPMPDHSGFTAEQLAEMRSQQEKLIRDLEFRVKMAQADFEIKKSEVDTGEVRATVDGQVVSLLDPEEARMTMQPMLKISGGGGYYVEGSVSELERDSLIIGQEVTINDWNTGMVYTGTIQSVGDAPSANGYWNGMGNPNASYYPFTVFVDGSADLQEGSYVSMVFTAGTAEHGVYLENPFLRTEQGRSYVYLRGEDGTLEKRFVTTGKSLWGSYTEILSGITAEDFIAFPYGKDIREGAPTREADLSELYEY